MELLKLAITVQEFDAPASLKSDRPDAEGLSFYRCRIELNGKAMQIQSPLAEKHNRQEMLMGFIEKAWAEISAQAFPPSEKPLIIAG